MRHAALHVLIISLLCVTAFAAEEGTPNLVRNPGFEEVGDTGLPAAWRGAPDVYSRDTAIKRSGEAALKYTNADPGRYVLCSQSVALEAGKKYEVSVWVRTEKVEGSDTGASICIEYSDKDGKYVGGSYPAGVKGTTKEWTRVRGVTQRIPESAASCSVHCYLRKEMTGTAWWDDVEIQRYHEYPLDVALLSPNYRNEVTDAGPEHLRCRVRLDLADHRQTLKDVSLVWQVDGGTGTGTVVLGSVDDIELPEEEMLIPAKDLKPGRTRCAWC